MTVRDSMQMALPDETATVELGSCMAGALVGGLVVYLKGELGAGKTTLVRALLRALGVAERVKSPTYSLLEPYTLADGRCAWHLDLYRIADPGELEWLGLDELSAASALVLVEWPERGAGRLPRADLRVHLQHAAHGRVAHLHAQSGRGQALIERMPAERRP